MDIPIEILWIFFALTSGLIAIGYIARFSIPISLFIFISGGLLFSMFIMIDNITIGSENTSNRVVNLQELYHLHDWNSERAIFAGFTTIRAIHINENSSLISTDFFDRMDCIQLALRKTGSPTGNADIAVFDVNGVLKPIRFGTLDVSTLTTTFTWSEFCLGASFHHFIKDGDYIGIRYAGGDVSNHIVVAVDTTNPIDGNIVMSAFLSGTWTDDPNIDLTAVMYNRALTEEAIYTPNNYEFTEELKVFMMLIAVIMALIGGAIEINARKN